MECKASIKVHNFNSLSSLFKQTEKLILLGMTEEWVNSNICVLHANCVLNRSTNINYMVDFELMPIPIDDRIVIGADQETSKVLEYFDTDSLVRLFTYVDSGHIRNIINTPATDILLNKLK